jgi:hypothetical protein
MRKERLEPERLLNCRLHEGIHQHGSVAWAALGQGFEVGGVVCGRGWGASSDRQFGGGPRPAARQLPAADDNDRDARAWRSTHSPAPSRRRPASWRTPGLPPWLPPAKGWACRRPAGTPGGSRWRAQRPAGCERWQEGGLGVPVSWGAWDGWAAATGCSVVGRGPQGGAGPRGGGGGACTQPPGTSTAVLLSDACRLWGCSCRRLPPGGPGEE